MNAETKAGATDILLNGLNRIVENYTKTALLMNACDVASKRYQESDEVILSTTTNIPEPQRLNPDIDCQFASKQLVEEYKSSVLEVVRNNYLVTSISIIDAVLEDLYELLLPSIYIDISELEIAKKVRDAWSNDNLINFLSSEDKVGLKKPDEMKTGYDELFLRYKELRTIRHSLVHSNGELSQKHLSALIDFEKATPPERKAYCIINTPLVSKENRVIVSQGAVFAIRKFLHDFLAFNIRAIDAR